MEKIIVIDDKIVPLDIFESYFKCSLDACKGACCYEGEMGAPITVEEADAIYRDVDKVKPLLSEESIYLIENKGIYKYYEEMHGLGTELRADGSCVFVVNKDGKALCAIDQAKQMHPNIAEKPISCQLYPVRVEPSEVPRWQKLRYDQWSICSSACSYGKEMGLPLYQFIKNGLIKYFGEDFYNSLERIHETYLYESEKEERS